MVVIGGISEQEYLFLGVDCKACTQVWCTKEYESKDEARGGCEWKPREKQLHRSLRMLVSCSMARAMANWHASTLDSSAVLV